jgi:hypothetical protein
VRTHRLYWRPDCDEASIFDTGTKHQVWDGNAAEIQVLYSKTCTVKAAQYHDNIRRDNGALGNLRWRLQRQWHRWFPE